MSAQVPSVTGLVTTPEVSTLVSSKSLALDALPGFPVGVLTEKQLYLPVLVQRGNRALEAQLASMLPRRHAQDVQK